MRGRRRRLSISLTSRIVRDVLLIPVALIAIGSCGDPTAPVVPVLATVSLSPLTSTLTSFGATQQLVVTASQSDGTAMSGVIISWTSSAPAVATVSASGLVTAVSNGTTTITASSGGLSTAATITVGQVLASVALTPSPSTLTSLGATQQLVATGKDAGGAAMTGLTVTYSTSAPAIASVNSSGLVTAVANGSAVITATIGTATATANISVAQAVNSISVGPTTASLSSIGATQQFTAAAFDANNNTVAGVSYVWSSSAPTVASVGTAGLVTGMGAGSATITATAGTKSGAAAVTVTPTVASVTVAPTSGSLTSVGATQQLTATPKDAGGVAITGVAITWSTSAATIATVSSTGLVTAIANGVATITATSGSASGTSSVTVAQAVNNIVFTPTSVTLTSIGATQQLTAVAKDVGGTTVAGATINFASSATGVAGVSAAGLVTAVTNGSATITASSGIVTATASIVVAQAINSVTVGPTTATLASVGATQQLTATAFDANNNGIAGATFTWTSSAPAVATVSSTGLVTAVATGSATITATSGTKSAAAVLTVTPTVASVTVTAAAATLTSVGATQQLTATPKDAGGTTIAGAAITWATSSAAIATVSSTGLVTAVANGVATITATSGTASGTSSITVAQAVNNIVLTPTPVTLTSIGATQQLTAVAKDAGGTTVAAATINFASSATGIASVSGSGLVTAVTGGSATITASSGIVTATASIVVAQAVNSVTVGPASATLASVGATQQLTASAFDANNNSIAGTTFTWTSSAPTVATVSSTGLVTAVAVGSATITATSGTTSGTSSITVAQAVNSIVMTPSPVTLTSIGATQQLTAVARDLGGAVIAGATITYASSAPAVASVNASGLVMAVANGSATITASSGVVTTTASIVVAQTVTSIVVTPAAPSVAPGSTQQMTATARDAGNTPVAGVTFTWVSTTPAVATISAAGLVSGVAAGTTTITATSGAISASTTATVVAVATVTITGAGTLTSLGATLQLTATARDVNGVIIPGVTYTWINFNTTVAAVSSTGLVTALANGTTLISAIGGGVAGNANVTVAQAVNSIAVTPGPLTIGAIGAAVTLTAAPTDANNNPVAGASITWSTSSAGVATVSSSGVVTTVANGSATITATSGIKTGTSAITVAQRLSAVAVLPPTAFAGLVAPGFTYFFTATAQDSLGVTIPGRTFTWASSAPAVATIASSGTSSVVGSGTTTITATSSTVGTETPRSGTSIYTVTVDQCQTRGLFTLTGVNYTSVGYKTSTVLASGDCGISLFGGTGAMTTGHRWNFNNVYTGSIEFLMISSAFSPVLQIRNGSTVIAQNDAGTGSMARFTATPGLGSSNLLFAGAKAGGSGAYELYVGKNANDLNGVQCAAISVLNVTTTQAVLGGTLGDATGCGSGASNTSDIYLLPVPYAPGQKHLALVVEGTGAQFGDLTFHPQIEIFNGDGVNLTLLPFSDPGYVEWNGCVPNSSSVIEYYRSVFGDCSNGEIGVSIPGGAPGLFFVRIRAAHAGQYVLGWHWVP